MTDKLWNTATLNIGESISKVFEGGSMAVDHLDRTIDPYAATVVVGSKIIYTGLHGSLSDARKTCELISSK